MKPTAWNEIKNAWRHEYSSMWNSLSTSSSAVMVILLLLTVQVYWPLSLREALLICREPSSNWLILGLATSAPQVSPSLWTHKILILAFLNGCKISRTPIYFLKCWLLSVILSISPIGHPKKQFPPNNNQDSWLEQFWHVRKGHPTGSSLSHHVTLGRGEPKVSQASSIICPSATEYIRPSSVRIWGGSSRKTKYKTEIYLVSRILRRK